MKVLFLSNLLLNLRKISSKPHYEKAKKITRSKDFIIHELATYVIYKEFEGKLYEKNIKMLNNENIELDYYLKFNFLFFDSIFKSGGFRTSSEFHQKFVYFHEKVLDIFYKKAVYKLKEAQNENFNDNLCGGFRIHKIIFEKTRKNFNFEHISAENIKKLFYFSSYLKNIEQIDLDDYFKNLKKFDLEKFIDLLNLEDINLTRELKKEKSKFNIIIFIPEKEVIDKAYKRLKKNINQFLEDNIEENIQDDSSNLTHL